MIKMNIHKTLSIKKMLDKKIEKTTNKHLLKPLNNAQM